MCRGDVGHCRHWDIGHGNRNLTSGQDLHLSGRGWTKGRSLSSTFKEVRKERDRERENTKKGEEREREREIRGMGFNP